MKNWIKKIIGFGLASFFGDINHEMTISLVPLLVTQFVGPELAPFFLGVISSVSDACASFLRLVSGFLTDRLSQKKPLIMLGYGISALFTTLMGFTHSLWQLLLCRILSFTGSGLREPPRDALIATIIEPKYYGRAFGLRNAMDTLGSLIGPIITFLCIGIVSLRTIFILSFIPGILAVCALFFLTQDLTIPQRKLPSWQKVWDNVLLLPRSFTIFVGILFIFELGTFNKLLLLSRAQEILALDALTSAQWLIFLYACFNSSRACSELIIGLISDYINRIFLLAILGCGTLAGVAFLLITPHASFISYVGIFVLAGISAAASLTLKKACAADMLPEHIRGLGYGVLQASEGFAALISSALIGLLWVRYSAAIAFVYVIVASLTALVSLILFETKVIH